MANNFLHQSYMHDAENSIKYLCKTSDVYETGPEFKTNCLDISSSINYQSFISHQCVQDLLARIWTGSIIADEMNFWQIKLGLLFPPLISTFRFQGNGDSDYLQNSKIPTMHFQKSLPRLEIPKLEDTLERYMKSQEPLLTPEQYEKTNKISKNFLGYEGRGKLNIKA